MRINKTKRSFLIITLGVALEHLDMMLVALLTSSIVEEFVGSANPAKFIYAYIGYAIAFLFRPLGAFCFGCIGDLYGRKTSLIASMALMSTATLTLAFLPGAQAPGILTILPFILCRIAQGLAVGGEFGTAMTYSFELNPNFQTFYGACLIASTHVGGLFASFLAIQYMGHFRMTFFIVGLLGLFLLLFRSSLSEHPVTNTKTISEIAIMSVKNKRTLLEAVIIASMLVLVFYGSLIYINELAHESLGIARSQLFKANALILGLWVILPPYFGYLTDKFSISYRKLMKFGALGVFLSAPLLGLTLTLNSYTAVLIMQIFMHLFHMLFCLCVPRLFGEIFTNQSRNTAISISYSLGASFTAALTPAICYINIAFFHSNFAICIPFMLIALAVIFILKKENLCNKMTLSSSTI